ncbi:MAG: CinA family protein [Clostridia bacterium]|nr:CinA family protein [Clostridia bacterium]
MRYDESAVRARWRQITLTLIEKELTITTMESATSGQIASLITDTEGASAVMKGAFITYSNEAKILQGVPAEIIATHSVYSRETARAMAEACRRTYRASIGIGVTGTMGNVDPANAAASVPGCVYFAIATEDATHDFFVELPPQPTRLAYKLAVADEVAAKLEKLL